MDKRKKQQVNNAVAIKALGQILINLEKQLQQRDREYVTHLAAIIDFLQEEFPKKLFDEKGEPVDLYNRFIKKISAGPVAKTPIVTPASEEFNLQVLDFSGGMKFSLNDGENHDQNNRETNSTNTTSESG